MSNDSPPRRIQLSRRRGWRMPPNTVSVARPGRWGNPHRVGLCGVCGVKHTQAEAVAEFEAELFADMNHQARDKVRCELAGKNLACFCGLDQPCHADTLLRVANDSSHADPLPCRPWVASEQYGMRFIVSAANEILWRADWMPMETLRVMAAAANDQLAANTGLGGGSTSAEADGSRTTTTKGSTMRKEN